VFRGLVRGEIKRKKSADVQHRSKKQKKTQLGNSLGRRVSNVLSLREEAREGGRGLTKRETDRQRERDTTQTETKDTEKPPFHQQRQQYDDETETSRY
jgi:hypothetical protein